MHLPSQSSCATSPLFHHSPWGLPCYSTPQARLLWKQLNCEKKLRDAPPCASMCAPYTLWLQSRTWSHGPGPWSLTELHCGCAMPALHLASPDLAFLTPWLDSGPLWDGALVREIPVLPYCQLTPLRGSPLAAYLVVLYWEHRRQKKSRIKTPVYWKRCISITVKVNWTVKVHCS